jgi:hypothetical protein
MGGSSDCAGFVGASLRFLVLCHPALARRQIERPVRGGEAKSGDRSSIDAIDAIRAMRFVRASAPDFGIYGRGGGRVSGLESLGGPIRGYSSTAGGFQPPDESMGDDRVFDDAEVARLVVLAVNIGNRRVHCR